MLIVYNKTIEPPTVYDVPCEQLSLDGTDLTFLGPCSTYNTSTVKIGHVEAVTTYVQSQELDIINPFLHQWLNASGDLGLSYCALSGNCPYTSFQQLLGASTQDPTLNQTFGLDFRNPNSSIRSISSNVSSIQLGGVKPEFNSSLNWLAQPTPSSVIYHQFFLKDFQFCGNALLDRKSVV